MTTDSGRSDNGNYQLSIFNYKLISSQRHRVTEFSSNYNLCISVPLCLYLQEIPGQARDEGRRSHKERVSLQ